MDIIIIVLFRDWLEGFINYWNFNILTGGGPYCLKYSENEIKEVYNSIKKEKEQLKEDNEKLTSEESQPRQSGSQEWRQARGEMGSNPEIPSNFKEDSCRILFQFNKFVETKTLKCLGTTSYKNNVLQLTGQNTSSAGACWFISPISIRESLVCSFQFQILHPGADGFAFVIVSIFIPLFYLYLLFFKQGEGLSALGKAGGEKGYGGITKCIAIDFDTYENYSQSEDPNNNHISIQSRGKIANTSHHRFALGCASNLPITLNDGNIHSVTIVYDCINHSCIVELNGQVILQISIELSSLLECDKAFIGFTAGTGGLTQTHNIISWKVMRPKSDK